MEPLGQIHVSIDIILRFMQPDAILIDTAVSFFESSLARRTFIKPRTAPAKIRRISRSS
jgi:hypothetical protein